MSDNDLYEGLDGSEQSPESSEPSYYDDPTGLYEGLDGGEPVTYKSQEEANQKAPMDAIRRNLDRLVEASAEDKKLRATLETAMSKNPDLMAEIQQLTKGTLIPSGADAASVLADSAEALRIRNRLSQDDIKNMKKDNPALYRYITKRNNAYISHDDIGVLGHIENVFKAIGQNVTGTVGGMLSGLNETANVAERTAQRSGAPTPANLFANTAGALSTPLLLADAYIGTKTGQPSTIARELAFKQVQKGIDIAGEGLKEVSQSIAVPQEQENIVTDIFGGIAQLATQAGVFALNPLAGYTGIVAQGIDEQAQRQKQSGAYGGGQWEDLGLLMGGGATGLTERIPLDDIFKRLPPEYGNRAYNYVLDKVISGGAEAGQEAVESIVQGVIEKITSNPDAEIIDEGIIDEMRKAGSSAAALRVLVGFFDKRDRSSASSDITMQHIDNRLSDASNEQEQLDQIVSLAQEAKTSGRSADAMAELVENFREEYDIDGDVYIDAERLQELYQDIDYDPDNPAVKRIIDQIPQAIAMKSDVVIPMEDFITHVVPGGNLEALRPYLTMSAGGLSQAEAEGVAPIRDEMIKNMREQAAKDVEKLEQATTIWQTVSEQLVETGRMGRREAELSASIYPAYISVYSQRSGHSVEGIFERMGVRVERGEIGDSDVSQPKQEILSDINATLSEPVKSTSEALLHDDPEVRRNAYQALLSRANVEFTDNGDTLSLAGGAEININGDKVEALNAIRGALGARSLNQARAEGYEGNDPVEGREWIEAQRKGLDMSQEARMERAQEMGYDTETPQYHGTAETFSEFQEGAEALGFSQGRDFYFTDDPANASSYTGNDAQLLQLFRNRDELQDGLAGGTQEARQAYNENEARIKERLAEVREGGPEGGNVIPTYLALENPMVIDAEGRTFRNINGGNNNTGRMDNPAFDGDPQTGERGESGEALFTEDERGRVPNRDIQYYVDQAKEAGHDGLIIRNVVDSATPLEVENQREQGGSTTTVVFNRNQIRSINAAFDPDNADSANILAQEAGATDQTETEAFKEWSKGAEVVEPDEINHTDFSEKRPYVLRVYHGTTNDFNVFDSTIKGNKEGHFGAINYFTSSYGDAESNYGFEGPDLTNRIERIAEQIEAEQEVDFDEAKEIAKKQLAGESEKVLELFVRTQKPFVVGDNEFLEFIDFDALEESALIRVAEEHDLDVADIEQNREQYEEEIDEARWEIEGDETNPLVDAIEAVALEFEVDASEVLGNVFELAQGVSAEGLDAFLRGEDGFIYAEDPETGDLISSHMVARVIQELGYDSIILKNADQQFSNMDIDSGTAHVHIFNEDNTNIKSATDNRGTFDPSDPNILNQSEEGLDVDLESAIDALFESSSTVGESVDANQTITGKPLGEDWQEQTAVAKDGKPIKIYRGGRSQLSAEHFDQANLGRKTGNPNATLGVWFSTDRNDASGYGQVSEFYLDIRNPKIYKTDDVPQFDSQAEANQLKAELQAQGHDGIAMDYSDVGGGVHYVAFDANQPIPANEVFYQNNVSPSDDSFAPNKEGKFEQGKRPGKSEARGSIQLLDNERIIRLGEASDLSTFLHESGHLFLEMEKQFSEEFGVTDDQQTLLDYLGVKSFDDIDPKTKKGVEAHEKFARSFEAYLYEGKAPSKALEKPFRAFRRWLTEIYKNIKRLNVRLTPEIKDVFDRMLATEAEIEAAHAEMQYSDLKPDIAPDRKPSDSPKENAKERLFKKLLAALTRQTKKWWKQDLDALYKANLEDIKRQPIHRAEAVIRGEVKLESAPDLDLRIDEQEAGEILGYKQPKIRRSKKPDAKYDSLLTFLAKAGGLSQQEASAQGFDPDFWTGKNATTINQPSFGKRIFAKKDGMTFDEARELASENGYLQGEDTLNAFIDLVEAEVRGEPQYSTSADLDYIYGEDAGSEIKHKPRRLYGLTKKGGIPADEAASLMGFDSGYELLTAIANSEKAEKVAMRDAELEMLRKHGDILNDGTLQEEAREAVHNEEQGKQLLADLKALNKRTGRQHAIDRQALQAEASKVISQLTVEKLTASVERFHKAEVKAAMAVKEAQTTNDTQAEIRARTQQLFNFYLYREARKVRDKADRQRKYLQDSHNRSYNAKQYNSDYIQHLKQYLSIFDFRKSANQEQKRQALLNTAKWLKDQQVVLEKLGENGPVIADPLINRILEAEASGDLASVELKNHRKLTIDELQAVHDMTKHMRFVARKMSEQKKMEDKAFFARLAESIESNLPRAKDGDGTVKTVEQEFLGYASQTFLTADRILRKLDGNKHLGPMYRATKSKIDEAVNNVKLPMLKKASEEMDEIYKKHYTKKELREFNKKVRVDGHPPIDRHDVIVMGMNQGSQGNKEALLGSQVFGERQYTEEQIDAYLDTLSRKDWEFIQDFINLIGTFKQPMGEVYQRLNGVSPQWVEATPIKTKYGTFKGGYVPIVFDGKKSIKAKKDEQQDAMESAKMGNFADAQTQAGFLEARVGSGGRPLLLELSAFHNHINKVVHYIALAEPVNEAQKAIGSEAVENAMGLTGQADLHTALDVWIKDTATGEIIASDSLSRWMRAIRTGYTVAKLTWNVSTMLVQPLGVIGAAPMVGYGKILKHSLKVFPTALGKNGAFARAQKLSSYMLFRAETFNKDLMDTASEMNKAWVGGRIPQPVKDSLFGGIAFMQRYADTIVFFAEYEKARGENASKKDAIYRAERMVERTQSSGTFSDRSAVERGSIGPKVRQSEMVRTWTVFASYFFRKANVIAEITGRTDFKNPIQVSKFLLDFMVTFAGEAIFIQLAKMATSALFGDDEEEFSITEAAKETGLTMLASYPFFRDAGSIVQGFDGGGATTSFLGDAVDLGRNIADIPEDGIDAQLLKSLNNVGGTLFKYPASATNRFGDALYRDLQGEDVSPEEYLIYRDKD